MSDFSKSNKTLKKLPTKKQTEKDKKALLSYLAEEYGLTYFGKSFVFKLEHIHNGTLQNLYEPIAYGVLLDMFIYYRCLLDKQRIYNTKTGKVFSSKQGELSYDLAIILSKHSDYVEKLTMERIKNAELTNSYSDSNLMSKVAACSSKDKIDINKMLDGW